jgi:4-amino-4-deoxy-L-arabinose transferase-like glycosyltransferase
MIKFSIGQTGGPALCVAMWTLSKTAVSGQIGATRTNHPGLQEDGLSNQSSTGVSPSTRKKVSRRALFGLLLILGLSALLNTIVAIKASLTTDEGLHLKYGEQILKLEPDRVAFGFYDSQMPVSALNAAPLAVAHYLEARHQLSPLSSDVRLVLGRAPTILATLVLGLLVFFWAYDLYGESAAFASCLLCTLSPNLIANGTLVTTDMYHAVGVVGSLFFVRRFLLRPNWTHAVFAGLGLAVAQITKSFAVALYFVVYIAIACLMLRRTTQSPLTPKRVFDFTVVAAVCLVAVLNVAFCFDRPFRSLSSYHIPQVQTLPVLGHLPVPFPYPFLQGLVLMKQDEKAGASYGKIYLLGELRDSADPTVRGFKSYYAVAYFYKEPIALQMLFLWGLVWVCRNRRLKDFIAGEGLLLMSAAILVVWFSFFSRAQIGIRHILPALAIETIIAGAAFSKFPAKPWPQKAVLSVLVLWLAGSMASYYPQMIPYMNEWLRDRRLSYRILADSNLDWGQDAAVVSEFLRRNPEVVLDPKTPIAGRVLVRANRLAGIYRGSSLVDLGKRHRPVAQVGYAHFLFDIPANDYVPPQMSNSSNSTH